MVMGFFITANILDFIKLTGVVGVGYFVMRMAYQLLINEHKKQHPSKTILVSIYTFMIFCLCVLGLGLASEFIKSRTRLGVRLGDNEIQLNEVSTLSSSSLNAKKYFINSEFDFAFKKPKKNWSEIKSDKGISGLFRIMQIESQQFNEQRLENAYRMSPLDSMLRNEELFYFFNPESVTILKPTDSTYTDITKLIYDQMSKQLSDSLRPIFENGDSVLMQKMIDSINASTKLDTSRKPKSAVEIGAMLMIPAITRGFKKNEEELDKIRKSLIGFDSIIDKEYFVVHVYNKNYLPEPFKKLTLPGFYTVFSGLTDIRSMVKLVANENQILVGSESKCSTY